METLLVILGAGASYDSVPETRWYGSVSREWRPPLARELFDFRPTTFGLAVDKFREAAPLVARLRRTVADGQQSVEQALQEVADQSVNYPRRERQVLALQLYIQEVILQSGSIWPAQSNGITNYVELVDRLELWRESEPSRKIVYVTFNYDTMLDTALSVMTAFENITSYIQQSAVQLLKVHGSVNWCQPLMSGGTNFSGDHRQALLRDHFGKFLPKDEVIVLKEPYQGHTPNGALAWPVIALPSVDKSDFVCPTWHIEALVESLRDVSSVLSIGWRGQDRHFMRLLADHLHTGPRFSAVAGSSSDDLEGALSRAGVRVRYGQVETTFSGLLDRLEFPNSLLP